MMLFFQFFYIFRFVYIFLNKSTNVTTLTNLNVFLNCVVDVLQLLLLLLLSRRRLFYFIFFALTFGIMAVLWWLPCTNLNNKFCCFCPSSSLPLFCFFFFFFYLRLSLPACGVLVTELQGEYGAATSAHTLNVCLPTATACLKLFIPVGETESLVMDEIQTLNISWGSSIYPATVAN